MPYWSWQLVEPLKWQLSRLCWLGTLRLLSLQKPSASVLYGKFIGVGLLSSPIVNPTVLFASLSNIKWIQPANAGNSTPLKELQVISGKDLDSRPSFLKRGPYKEKGVKTSSAFLPLLIQMPVLAGFVPSAEPCRIPKVGHFLCWTWCDRPDLYLAGSCSTSSHFQQLVDPQSHARA